MSEQAQSIFKVSLMGQFEITQNNHPIDPQRWGQRKTVQLLKYFLSHRGEVITTDRLIDELYPESDPSKILRNLQGRISELRKGLEPELERGTDSAYLERVGKGTYRFTDDSSFWIDIEAFSRLRSEGEALCSISDWAAAAPLLQEAIELYRGEFLSEDLYDEWTLAIRERYRDMFIDILSSAAECEAHLERYSKAISLIKTAMMYDPYSEDICQKLMRYHAYAGQPNYAIIFYQSFKERLASELDVEPSGHTAELLQSIQNNEISQPERTTPHNLHAPLTSFIGREDEIAQLMTELEKTRLLTLTGIGGAGKTRLGLEVAKQQLEFFTDGVWFIDLAAVEDPKQIPPVLASTLGIKERGGQSVTDAIMAHLEHGKVLLILDNCEQIIGEAAKFTEKLLQACPDLKILVTSRQSMNISGETVYDVPPLTLPCDQDSIANLREFDAIKLFEERARASRSEYSLSESDAGIVLKICREIDGLPLAIELAAARMKLLSPLQIAERLEDRFRLLSRGSNTAEPRQQTLWAMIDWSFNLLDEMGQKLLPRLSVFRGGFTLEAVENICAGDGIEKSRALDLLTDLAERSLILIGDRGDAVRYRLLETVRHFGEEKLAESGHNESLKLAHLTHFMAMAEEAEPHFIGPEQRSALSKVESEHDNIRAAIDWALQSKRDLSTQGLRLVAALGKYWELQSRWTEGRTLLDGAVRSANDAPPETRAKALRASGFIAFRQGDYESALDQQTEGLRLSQSASDLPGEGFALNNLGSIHWAKADLLMAQEYYEQALNVFEKAQDAYGLSASLHNLALIAQENGDLERARHMYEKSLRAKRKIADQANIAITLNNLGNIAFQQGDYDYAIEIHEEALSLRKESGDQGMIASSLTNLGNMFWSKGELESAGTYYRESIVIKREIGDQAGIARSINNLGSVYKSLRNFDAARLSYREALRLRRELNDARGIASSLTNLATLESSLNNFSQAKTHLIESVGLSIELGERLALAQSLAQIAHCYAKADDYSSAAQLIAMTEYLIEQTQGALEPDAFNFYTSCNALLDEALSDQQRRSYTEDGLALEIEDLLDFIKTR